MDNNQLMLTAIDTLLAVIVVMFANFILSNYPENTSNSIGNDLDIAYYDIVNNYPIGNAPDLNFIYTTIDNSIYQVDIITNGKIEKEQKFSTLNSLLLWIAENANTIRRSNKPLILHEKTQDSAALASIIRTAHTYKLKTGYAE